MHAVEPMLTDSIDSAPLQQTYFANPAYALEGFIEEPTQKPEKKRKSSKCMHRYDRH